MEKISTQIPAASSPRRCRMNGQRKNPTTTLMPSANQLELTFLMICRFSNFCIGMTCPPFRPGNIDPCSRNLFDSAMLNCGGRGYQLSNLSGSWHCRKNAKDHVHPVLLQVDLP